MERCCFIFEAVNGLRVNFRALAFHAHIQNQPQPISHIDSIFGISSVGSGIGNSSPPKYRPIFGIGLVGLKGLHNNRAPGLYSGPNYNVFKRHNSLIGDGPESSRAHMRSPKAELRCAPDLFLKCFQCFQTILGLYLKQSASVLM